VKGWVGWLIVVLFIVAWDVSALFTGWQTLTSSFRHGVAETAWRWPVAVLLVLFAVHLFEPVRWRQHDPLDRLYHSVEARRAESAAGKTPRAQ
jgi:hypothetical protein